MDHAGGLYATLVGGKRDGDSVASVAVISETRQAVTDAEGVEAAPAEDEIVEMIDGPSEDTAPRTNGVA